ncbi:alpha-L-fucosidase [Pseudarthrobacter sp. P1]|uniref:alpha-L-fucosidase n=1 Tax=Pseudarthrobacter sp. P1 TaxID=3418418 RepID=UPI003CFB877C
MPQTVPMDSLNVGFTGSLMGTTAYTSTGGETMHGILHRISGGETQVPGSGVRLAGGTQGIRYEPFDLPTGTADSGFLGELRFTPTEPATMSTLFATGGNVYIRAQDGQLRYGFDSLAGQSWTTHVAEVDYPSLDREHALSFHYLPSAVGAVLTVWLDGVALPPVSSGHPATHGARLGAVFGFGNEANEANEANAEGLGRGFTGTLHKVRLAATTAAFTPSDFGFQPLPATTALESWEPPALDPANFIPVASTDSPRTILAKAALVRPTLPQLRWQEARQTAFVHFGINTFYDQEWGHGTEDPARFNPTDFDADSWVRTLRDNGFRYAILTVKHHDGFLSYPSRYTAYSVKSSPWRGGKGDVLREFPTAARRYGMKVGICLSPADSNQEADGVFGNGSAKSMRTIPTLVAGDDRVGKDLPRFHYEATDYGAFFLNTLYETLTEYGQIDEVWFDGAGGNTAKRELYDYPAFHELIGKLQPHAVVAVGGRDVRWVGNEEAWRGTVNGAPSLSRCPVAAGRSTAFRARWTPGSARAPRSWRRSGAERPTACIGGRPRRT